MEQVPGNQATVVLTQQGEHCDPFRFINIR